MNRVDENNFDNGGIDNVFNQDPFTGNAKVERAGFVIYMIQKPMSTIFIRIFFIGVFVLILGLILLAYRVHTGIPILEDIPLWLNMILFIPGNICIFAIIFSRYSWRIYQQKRPYLLATMAMGGLNREFILTFLLDHPFVELVRNKVIDDVTMDEDLNRYREIYFQTISERLLRDDLNEDTTDASHSDEDSQNLHAEILLHILTKASGTSALENDTMLLLNFVQSQDNQDDEIEMIRSSRKAGKKTDKSKPKTQPKKKNLTNKKNEPEQQNPPTPEKQGEVEPSETDEMKKEDLPKKICPVCKRSFTWRKKWERNWSTVVYCSEACRQRKNWKV